METPINSGFNFISECEIVLAKKGSHTNTQSIHTHIYVCIFTHIIGGGGFAI